MKKSAFNKIVFSLVASTFATSVAMAQTTITETVETAEVVIVQDYSFDLDQTSDPSLAPLPADAGDYEVASPGEIQTTESFTFDLE